MWYLLNKKKKLKKNLKIENAAFMYVRQIIFKSNEENLVLDPIK